MKQLWGSSKEDNIKRDQWPTFEMISLSNLWEDSTCMSLANNTKNRRTTSKVIKKSLLTRLSEEGHSLPREGWSLRVTRKLRKFHRDLEKGSEEQNMVITTEKCTKIRQTS